MNWGRILAWSTVALSVGASVGYLVIKDYRRALYYFFAACITATISW